MSDSETHTRRRFLRRAAASGTAAAAGLGALAPAACAPAEAPVAGLDPGKLQRLAEILLPTEVDPTERDDVVDGFLAWLRGYRGDAEMDHGYGFTRERHTPPSPEPGYVADLAELEAAVGGDLIAADDEQLLAAVSAALEAAAPETSGIPGRPDDSHVALGLMSHYYRGAPATDRCYGVAIRREVCRGLFTDVDELRDLDPGDRP